MRQYVAINLKSLKGGSYYPYNSMIVYTSVIFHVHTQLYALLFSAGTVYSLFPCLPTPGQSLPVQSSQKRSEYGNKIKNNEN